MTALETLTHFEHFGDLPDISDEKIEEFIKSDNHSQYLLDSGLVHQKLRIFSLSFVLYKNCFYTGLNNRTKDLAEQILTEMIPPHFEHLLSQDDLLTLGTVSRLISQFYGTVALAKLHHGIGLKN